MSSFRKTIQIMKWQQLEAITFRLAAVWESFTFDPQHPFMWCSGQDMNRSTTLCHMDHKPFKLRTGVNAAVDVITLTGSVPVQWLIQIQEGGESRTVYDLLWSDSGSIINADYFLLLLSSWILIAISSLLKLKQLGALEQRVITWCVHIYGAFIYWYLF